MNFRKFIYIFELPLIVILGITLIWISLQIETPLTFEGTFFSVSVGILFLFLIVLIAIISENYKTQHYKEEEEDYLSEEDSEDIQDGEGEEEDFGEDFGEDFEEEIGKNYEKRGLERGYKADYR